MKKFIIFRTDRLGDFLIISSILKAIKKRYPESHITVVGSELNYKIIKSYKIIDRVLIYNKYYSITKKIKIFKDINKTKYYCSLSLDGKSFSNIVNFFLKAEIKLGVSYKFNLLSPFLKWSKPNFLYNYLIFDKFEFFSSKKSLYKIEHLPSILIKLSNNLQLKLKKKDPYFFEVKKSNNLIAKNIFKKKIMGKFILIHLDEKWNDIKLIEKDFFSELLIFQKKMRRKIVISSNKNNFIYYKLLKKNLKNNKDFIFLENLNLNIFERIISFSSLSISCHSGFLVQIAGFNKTSLIDIINKKDFMWYSCWKPLNTNHKFIFKSNLNNKISLNNIFNKIVTYHKNNL